MFSLEGPAEEGNRKSMSPCLDDKERKTFELQAGTFIQNKPTPSAHSLDFQQAEGLVL